MILKNKVFRCAKSTSLVGTIIILSFCSFGIVPLQAQIEPDQITLSDFSFLPDVTQEFVDAYKIFLKAKAGDQKEETDFSIPTYTQAAEAFGKAAKTTNSTQLKTRSLYFASFGYLLDINIHQAYLTALEMLTSAKTTSQKRVNALEEIIKEIKDGNLANFDGLLGYTDKVAGKDEEEISVLKNLILGFSAILNRETKTKELIKGIKDKGLIQTKIFNVGIEKEQLISVLIAAGFFRDASISLPENIEKVNQAICVSNLRQLGVALHLYAQDYDRFPLAEDLSTTTVWHWKIMPYLGPLPSDWSQRSNVWRCPSLSSDARVNGYSYGMNMCVNDPYGGGYGGVLAKIPNPSSIMLVADSVHYSPGSYPNNPSYSGAAFFIRDAYEHGGIGTVDRTRHSGGANSLFVDGHVEWLPASKIPTHPGLFWTGKKE